MTATVHTPQNSNRADRFAIIIPVYNHGKTVADVARGCLEWDLPVYVVDDGSTDDTYAKIKTVEGVRILRHDHNKGKGAALIYGMTEAAGVADWAICLDADGQHDPNEIEVFMTAVRSHFNPEHVVIKKGDHVTWHITNIETALDATHGFQLPAYNISLSIEPGEVTSFDFVADRDGTFAWYCTEFCSALHLEMLGYMLVEP